MTALVIPGKVGRLVGKLSIEPSGPVVAGSTRDFRIRIVIGPQPPAKGTVFQVAIPIGWAPPTKEKCRPGSVSVETTARACLLVDIVRRRYVRLNMTGGEFIPGDEIVLRYGCSPVSDNGEEYSTVQKWVVDSDPSFEVEIDDGGLGKFVAVSGALAVKVIPDEPAYLHVCVPSVVKRGEDFPIRFTPLDRFGNKVADWVTDWESIDLSCSGMETEQCISQERIEARLTQSGTHHIRLSVRNLIDGTTLSGVSNPCKVSSNEAQRVFWGDLHVHSTVSDGAGSVEFCYDYAKDVSMLDFAAVTDHDFELHHAWFTRRHQRISDAQWERSCAAAKDFTLPGEFVAFAAYEWTGRPYGDKCVYFAGDVNLPIFRCEDTEYSTPEQLWAALETIGPEKVMTISHTTTHEFMGSDWSCSDERFENLVEIYSMHGSSESHDGLRSIQGSVGGRSVKDALGKGYKLGFVAGGDMHSSQPGNPRLSRGPYRTLRYRAGLTGVICKGRTREEIFRALKLRRCYATTGERMILDFKINQTEMGDMLDLHQPDERLRFHIFVAGTAPLQKVEIIANGETYREVDVYGDSMEVKCEFDAQATISPQGFPTYYYLRVIQNNGEMAWSSPIWVRMKTR